VGAGETAPSNGQLVRRIIGDRECLVDLDTGEIQDR
jgi:hypothetical protein